MSDPVHRPGACRTRLRRRHRGRRRHPAHHAQDRSPAAACVTMDDDDSVPLPFRSVTAETMTSYPLSYTVAADRLSPQRGRPQLRRRAGPEVDAAHPRHPEEVPRRRGVLHDRRGGAEQRRLDAARLQRRPRDRQSHLHAPGHQRNLGPQRGPGAEPHRTPLRRRTGRAAALLPPSLLHRPGARHQRPGRPRRPHSGPRLRHRRRQDRHQRLG